MTGRTAKAAAGTISGIAQYLVQLAVVVVVTPAVIRFAGQEVLGAYAAIGQALGYLVLVDFGFAVAVARFLPQAYGADDGWQSFNRVLSLSRTAALVSNLVYAALCVPLALALPTMLDLSPVVAAEARTGLLVLAAWAAVRGPFTIYNGALLATQSIAATNLIMMGGTLIRFAATLALVAAGHGLVGILVAMILGELATVVGQAWVFRRRYPRVSLTWRVPGTGLLREMLAFSGQAMLINIAVRLVFYTDNLVVGSLYGAAAAAAYYATQQPSLVGASIIWKLADSSVPAFNELIARGLLDRLRAAYCAVMRISLVGAFGLALGLVTFNRPVVDAWLGPRLFSGNLMTVALAAFVVVQTVNHINGSILVAFGELRWLSIGSIAGGLANLALSLWLGRLFGLQWVMVASVMVDLPGFPFFAARSLRRLGLSFREVGSRSLLPAVAACAPCLVLATAIYAFGIPPGIVWLLALMCAFMLLLAVGAWGLGLTAEERGMTKERVAALLRP